jgi:hypothetical protein
MRKPLIRWPLTLVLLWLAWLAGSQWMSQLVDDEDWTQDYPRETATIVGSRADYSSSASGKGSWTCVLIVEWQYDGQTYRDEPIWLHGGFSSNRLGDNCGEARLGEGVTVWIGGTDAAEPYLVEPENRSAKPLTGIANALQMLLFLGLLWLLWRPRRRLSDETAN